MKSGSGVLVDFTAGTVRHEGDCVRYIYSQVIERKRKTQWITAIVLMLQQVEGAWHHPCFHARCSLLFNCRNHFTYHSTELHCSDFHFTHCTSHHFYWTMTCYSVFLSSLHFTSLHCAALHCSSPAQISLCPGSLLCLAHASWAWSGQVKQSRGKVSKVNVQ